MTPLFRYQCLPLRCYIDISIIIIYSPPALCNGCNLPIWYTDTWNELHNLAICSTKAGMLDTSTYLLFLFFFISLFIEAPILLPSSPHRWRNKFHSHLLLWYKKFPNFHKVGNFVFTPILLKDYCRNLAPSVRKTFHFCLLGSWILQHGGLLDGMNLCIIFETIE